jgi:putative hydrolase of the HAD superfamily
MNTMIASLQRRRVALFDAGGTLITLDHDRVRRSLQPVSEAIPSDEAFELAEAGARLWADGAIRARMSGRELWNGYFGSLLAGAGVEEPAIEACIEALWEANQTQGLWRKPIAGAREVIAQLRGAGFRMSVVSNAEGQVENDLLDAGFGNSWETVVDSHVVGVAKPDPRIFEIALERMGVSADEAFYVGDVPYFDVAGARAAGMPAVLIDPHAIHAATTEALRIASIRELPALLGL